MPSGINAQAVYNGKDGVVDDRIWGGKDNDTFWGGEGNDIIEGGDGADIALGGEGNDIITDLAGDDVPKGGPGNDAIDGGPGLDIIMAGEGDDFTNGGANTNETFLGAGDDFAIAGQGLDAVFGDSGDDWAEGGDQPDLLIGDSSTLFFDDHNLPGHDILIGQGGDDDYDLEGGDDIGVAGPGVEKVAGAAGYDWEIGLGDPQAQDMDLTQVFVVGGVLLPGVRDKYNEVEALSGWNFNDILRGDDIVPTAVGGGGFVGCDALDAAGRRPDQRPDALVPPRAPSTRQPDRGLGDEPLPAHRQRLGRWQHPARRRRQRPPRRPRRRRHPRRRPLSQRPAQHPHRRCDPNTEFGTTALMENVPDRHLRHRLRRADPAAGSVRRPHRPGQHRGRSRDAPTRQRHRHRHGALRGPGGDYTVTRNDDGSVTVAHTAPVGGGGVAVDDGTDTLWNMERAQFADVVTSPETRRPTSTIVNDSCRGPGAQRDDCPRRSRRCRGAAPNWQVETAPDMFVNVSTGPSFTPGDAQVGHRLRLAVTFTDDAGFAEQAFSAPTTGSSTSTTSPSGYRR